MLRLWRIERRAYALLRVFTICDGLIIATHLATPSDLMFLPSVLLAEPQWFDLASAQFFFTAAFAGGVLQMYNLADRGFSLRILIDLREWPDQRGTVETLFHGYSAGRGMGWMYQKRINDMSENGLITVNGRDVKLTERGSRTAQLFWRLRWLYRFGFN